MNVHISTLTDDELDAVAGAAASFTFSVSSNQLGNTGSTGAVTATVNQGATGQNIAISGNFGTT